MYWLCTGYKGTGHTSAELPTWEDAQNLYWAIADLARATPDKPELFSVWVYDTDQQVVLGWCPDPPPVIRLETDATVPVRKVKRVADPSLIPLLTGGSP